MTLILLDWKGGARFIQLSKKVAKCIPKRFGPKAKSADPL